jgi:hypothetical protein
VVQFKSQFKTSSGKSEVNPDFETAPGWTLTKTTNIDLIVTSRFALRIL